MDVRDRATVLDAMCTGVANVERRRDPTEPSPEINDAYVKLLFACGHAVVDNEARARELQADARAQMEPHRNDPIHAWLLDAFDVRIADAPAGGLPPPLLARLDALDRVVRYKLDRFREGSRILAGESVIPIHRFSGTAEFRDEAPAMRAFAAAETATQGLLDAYVQAAVGVSNTTPDVGRRILDRAEPWFDRVSQDQRGLAYARAIQIAARAVPERVPGLVERLGPVLAHVASWEIDEVLSLLVRTVPDHLATLWPRAAASAQQTQAYLVGRLRLGQPPAMHEVRAAVNDSHVTDDLVDAVADAYTTRPFSERFAELWALELFALASDDHSTNSHFTYSVIHVVDRIVGCVLHF